MSSVRGTRADRSGYDRKRAKKAQRRRPHVDKYADRRMDERLSSLAERFNSEERDRERR